MYRVRPEHTDASNTALVRTVQQFVPSDATMVIAWSSSTYDPMSALHGPRLTRKLIYSDQQPDAHSIALWRAAGVRWLLLLQSETQIDDPAQRGLRPVAERLYEIP